MKFWGKWKKISAGLLLGTMCLLGGWNAVSGQSVNWDGIEDIPENLIIKKSGFELPDKVEEGIKAFTSKIEVGPGARLFGGAKLTLLANQTASQMLSVVIETSNGNLIVVDGGTQGDANHLIETLRAKGGRVSAWFVTHPHSDHIGALTEILNNASNQITVDHVYYSMADQSWYDTNETYRADTVTQFREALTKLPPESVHGDIKRGQEIWVDNIKITVMNEPYLFENNAINNSSVGYKVLINNVKVMFLGDMGVEAGDRFLAEHTPEELQCDILQMAHHGQNGVTRQVYEAMRPRICLWPTPDWLWNNDNGGGTGSGPWATEETRKWMTEIGTAVNYCIKDGDQILQ